MGPGGPSVTQGQMPVAPQPPPTYPSRSPSRPASAARRGPRRSGRSRGHRRTAGELPCCPRRPWNVGRARGGPPVLTNRLPRPRPDQSGVQALAQEPIGRRGGTRACAQHPRRPHEGTTGSAEAAGALMPRLPVYPSRSSQVLHPLPHRWGPGERLASRHYLSSRPSGPFLENPWEAGATGSNWKPPGQGQDRALGCAEIRIGRLVY